MTHLLLIALLAQSEPRDSVIYLLSPASRLEVTTGKGGLLGFAGHEHTIRARAFTGRIVYRPDSISASHFDITVPTDSLEVLTPPDTEEIRKVTAAMRSAVLDVANYPEIRLVSLRITGNTPRLQLIAALTIKGRTREVPISVTLEISPDTLRAISAFTVRQTDFGIRPYRGGPAGLVRVADRVKFAIQVLATRCSGPHC